MRDNVKSFTKSQARLNMCEVGYPMHMKHPQLKILTVSGRKILVSIYVDYQSGYCLVECDP